jgi:hypothetical protein
MVFSQNQANGCFLGIKCEHETANWAGKKNLTGLFGCVIIQPSLFKN